MTTPRERAEDRMTLNYPVEITKKPSKKEKKGKTNEPESN